MRKILFSALLLCFFFTQTGASGAVLSFETPLDFSFSQENEVMEIEINHPGNKKIAIEVDFSTTATTTGAIRMVGASTIKAGPVEWNNNFDRELFAHDGQISVVDNLLPAPGKWQITLTAMNAPVSGKLRLIDHGSVPAIEYSEKTGAIQIKKPGTLEMIAVGKADHPDFPSSDSEFRGSISADGDIIIPLPPGFYSLKHPAATVNSMQAHMIPVHAGKITIIENWPQAPQPDVSDDGNDAEKTASMSAQIEKELRIRSARLLENDQVNVRFATPNWQGIVSKEDLNAHESGIQTEVISAGTVATPLNLTILLDSSGSMKKDMKLALASVEQFIKLLPDDSEITLIDFDTKTKEIPGKDRASLLKTLKTIKADGATCLNDSVMIGLQKSENKGRPAILLFTDGFDANHNDTGPGSKTSPEEMFAAVKSAEVPVFTIGFGAKPDDATLKRLATLSGGFYNKADKDNISKVFAQVASILGREHEMVYKRPGIRGNSDAPVISIVLDISGSMNNSPVDEGCDYRLEKAKAILRNLITRLPEDAIAQITTYNYYQDIAQVFTGDKIQLLESLAPVQAGGGTETLATLKIAFKMLNEIPTDRKYLLFITDAGLDIKENEIDYQAVLGSIKDAGIHTTWIGMVAAEKKEPFDLAAKLCQGQAVVSTDFSAVQNAIDNLGKSILTATGTTDGKIPVKLTFSRREENGRILIMNAADKFPLPAPPVTSKAAVNGLKISFAELPQALQRYNLELSQALYGNSKTREETVISQRLPINAVSRNKAMQITVIEALMISRFRGINQQCLALKLKLENLLPEQEVAVMSASELHPASFVGQSVKPQKTIRAIPPYMIPDLRTHFFASLNSLPAAAVSDLSWIVEDPLLSPDDASLLLKPGEPIEGYLVFEYDTSETVAKASLNYFDTVYGHLQIPIIGTIDAASNTAYITSLPETPAGHISEAFRLSLKGFSDITMPEPISFLSQRTYDLQMTSQVQAHLDLNPTERLSLMLPTRFGNLVLNPSPRTASIPMGWYEPVLFLPGSNNFLKQAYMLPESLGKKVKGTLRLDISGNEILLPAGDKPVSPDKPVITGEGDKIKLSINAYKIEYGKGYFDVTLHDEKDGSGTTIPAADLLQMKIGETLFLPETANCEYLFQCQDQVEVADGQQRRMLLIINCSVGQEETATPVLKSEPFKIDLPLKSLSQGVLDDYMLCGNDNYQPRPGNREEILALCEKVHAERLASGWKKKGSSGSNRISLGAKPDNGQTASDSGPLEGINLLPPDFKGAMSKRLQQILQMPESEFLAFLQKFRCVPAEANSRKGLYAPEALLMQDWGTPSDLLELAKVYYKSTGALVDEKYRFAVLTEKGKEELLKQTSWKTELTRLPILQIGKRQLVLPFCRDLEQIGDLVSEVVDEDFGDMQDRSISLSINLRVKPKNSGQAAMMGSMGSALGGEEDDGGISEIPLFSTNLLSDSSCSLAPIDFYYYSPDYGKTLYVVAEGAEGRLENLTPPVSIAENEVVEEVIEIRTAEDTLVYARPVEKDVDILDTFRTIALSMPDITASASKAIEEEFAARKTVEAPGTRSTAKWFTRSKIYQFLAMQSAAEAEASSITGVKIARPGKQMRAIILTLSAEKDNLRALLDLRQINPVVQGEAQAVKAFNFFMGTTNAMLEEQVMGGGGLLSRWSGGKQQQLVIAGPDNIGTLIEGLEPELISTNAVAQLQKAAENGKGVIFPLHAPVYAGKAMVSWFTFDPETYEMISVLDNGAHGSLVEKPITEIIQDAAKYAVGFLVGVNTSVWAVTAYTLKYDDLRLIVKAAKKLCLGIAEQLKDIGKPLHEFIPTSYTAKEVSASVGPATIKLGFGEITPTSFKLMTKPSLGFNFDYQSGFEDAVKAYFHD